MPNPPNIFPAAIPEDRKKGILDDAFVQIMAGRTLIQIGADYGIHHKTLQRWLLAMGDEYKELRKAYIDNILIESREALRDSTDALSLAHAREGWKADTWLASKVDARYADKPPEQTINIGGSYLDTLRKVAEMDKVVNKDD
jgi:hypothetical protein